MFCCHKRSFNRKEKVLTFTFLEILEKIAGMTKISPQKMNHELLENALTDFSLILRTSCEG